MRKLLIIVCLISFLLPGVAWADLSTGLVGYWPLDRRDGNGTSFDRSGSGNTGTWVNSPTISLGKIGQALRLNGSSQYVTTISNFPISTGSFTISAWLNTNITTRQRFITSFNTTGFVFDVNEASGGAASVYGDLRIKLFDNSSHTFEYVVAAGITVNKWYLASVVIDRSANTLKMYVNGSQVGTTQNMSAITGSLASSMPLNFGQNVSSGTYFSGQIDDVRIYNRALPSGEVNQLYRLGVGNHFGSFNGLLLIK